VNRNQLITGLVILAAFTILVISGSVLVREWNARQAHVGQRKPLPRLSYCSSDQVKPCILSFNLDADKNMVINVLSESPSSVDFYIKIMTSTGENTYQCQRPKGLSNSIACVGQAMPVGEILQFLLVSRREDILLAEGRFPIIGLALSPPEVASSTTSATSITPASPLPTLGFVTMTPTPSEVSPVASPRPSPTHGSLTATPTLVNEGPPGASSPPPFSTPIGGPTDTDDEPPSSNEGPPGP
jgi:hypothetical protein